MTRARWTAVAGLSVVTLVAGVALAFSSRDGVSSTAASTSSPAARTTTTPKLRETTTTTRPATGSGKPVVIAFGGDVHFEGILRSQLDENATGMLAPVAPLLSPADLAVVNLETAITERGAPATKEFVFRAPARAFVALAAAGVDVAGMANNHGLDYGPDGLADSLASSAAAHFPIIGIGNNANQAYEPYRATVRGQRIAVIAATQVIDNNLISAWTATESQGGLASAKNVDRLVQAVRAARAAADTVVVFLHWGVEQQTCPSANQEALAITLVAAGADVVVGGHAHRLQGGGRLGNAFVDYGLGNFVFYTAGGPGTESGVLYLTVTGRRIDGYRFAPAVLQNGVAHPLSGDAAGAALAHWDGLRSCTNLTP
ncbi:MAG: Poly-gamma-glutamate biosynthesis protein [Actinomycetia bacterium]|nr:Poly-gamma-glutamate biosynthesis protein [Actinomycetes bacterium]